MAKSKTKAAKAGGTAAAAKTYPYVQQLMSDEDLRDNITTAFESLRSAYNRLSNGKGPAALLDDKKLQRDLQHAATNIKDASDTLRDGPRKKRKGGVLRKLLLLAIVGGGVAVGVNEGIRTKVLDLLFGKEEQFDYQSTTAPAAPPPTPAATSTST